MGRWKAVGQRGSVVRQDKGNAVPYRTPASFPEPTDAFSHHARTMHGVTIP